MRIGFINNVTKLTKLFQLDLILLIHHHFFVYFLNILYR